MSIPVFSTCLGKTGKGTESTPRHRLAEANDVMHRKEFRARKIWDGRKWRHRFFVKGKRTKRQRGRKERTVREGV